MNQYYNWCTKLWNQRSICSESNMVLCIYSHLFFQMCWINFPTRVAAIHSSNVLFYITIEYLQSYILSNAVVYFDIAIPVLAKVTFGMTTLSKALLFWSSYFSPALTFLGLLQLSTAATFKRNYIRHQDLLRKMDFFQKPPAVVYFHSSVNSLKSRFVLLVEKPKWSSTLSNVLFFYKIRWSHPFFHVECLFFHGAVAVSHSFKATIYIAETSCSHQLF